MTMWKDNPDEYAKEFREFIISELGNEFIEITDIDTGKYLSSFEMYIAKDYYLKCFFNKEKNRLEMPVYNISGYIGLLGDGYSNLNKSPEEVRNVEVHNIRVLLRKYKEIYCEEA